MTALVFGAGKMACGLLGQLLAQSGYTTVFVARRPEVIDAINRCNGYSLEVAAEQPARLTIRNCAALSIHDQCGVAAAVAGADVVFTAVGVDNLAAITPGLADGLWQRSRSPGRAALNIVASENLPGAGPYLCHQVLNAAAPRNALALERAGGFSSALTCRIMTGGTIQDGELTFAVDADYDLIIDTHGLKGVFPDLHGATLTENFPAMVMRKLFLLNCAHAAAAYLGYREGCAYVHEAATHPRLMPVVQGALAEAADALKAQLPDQVAAIDQDVAMALRRIANPRLVDPISRVARDPRRKLSSRERLLGPARLASQHGLAYDNLCTVIATALLYDDPADPQAVELQRAIAVEGLDQVLTEDCGLLPHEQLARAVKAEWHRLAAGALRRPARLSDSLSGDVSLELIMRSLAADLSERFDPCLVKEILDHVSREFRDARIWSFVPILMKKRVCEQLREATR